MPQLFPMNWNFLTLYFLLIISISAILVYFTHKPNLPFSSKKMNDLSKFWKW
uniref:ATP synthase F0 subunit 8 n=1 Tax=Alectorobius peruvianus TaxID=879266 RepID=UPI002237B3BF|nr:ATP synthase F0 subunit 8 [Alectorobius peruvianus]UYB78525.1 ATP synthase F0 subunit 8 [Alectorobius peruvianus]